MVTGNSNLLLGLREQQRYSVRGHVAFRLRQCCEFSALVHGAGMRNDFKDISSGLEKNQAP